MANRTRSKDEDRIVAAIRAMGAYGNSALLRAKPMAEARSTREPISLEDLAEFLEALAAVLEDSARDEKATEAELSDLRAEIRCIRRFLERLGVQLVEPQHVVST